MPGIQGHNPLIIKHKIYYAVSTRGNPPRLIRPLLSLADARKYLEPLPNHLKDLFQIERVKITQKGWTENSYYIVFQDRPLPPSEQPFKRSPAFLPLSSLLLSGKVVKSMTPPLFRMRRGNNPYNVSVLNDTPRAARDIQPWLRQRLRISSTDSNESPHSTKRAYG